MELIYNALPENEAKRILRNGARGRKPIGSGATAVVYGYGNDKVIRVETPSDDSSPEEYLRWAKFCLKSKSKHTPKIYMIAVKLNSFGNAVKTCVVTEKLHVANCTSWGDAIAVESYINGNRTDEELKQRLENNIFKVFPLRAMKALRGSLRQAAIEITDLHEENWMIRKSDNRLVITDPLY